MNIDYTKLGMTQAVLYLLQCDAAQQRSKIHSRVALQIEIELEALDVTAGPNHPFYAQIQALRAWSGGNWTLASFGRADDLLRELLTPELVFEGFNGALGLRPSMSWRLFSTLPAELQEKLLAIRPE
jgi:hypothetical protein